MPTDLFQKDMDRAKHWFNTRVLEPGKEYVTSGTEPTKLALSAAVGWCCGLCPLLGVSAGLCCVAILVSRGKLHGPMTLLANLLSVPVELLMIPVYMHMGQLMTGAPHESFPRISLRDLFGVGGAKLLRLIGRALLAWVITWPLLVGSLYFVLTPAFVWLQTRYQARRGAIPVGGYSPAPTTPDGVQPLMPLGVSTDGSITEVGLVPQDSDARMD